MPLNADRAFVATSLIHAAFELGNPDTTTLGVDPHAGEDSFAKIKAFLSLALYKGKVIVHGLLHKILLGYTTSPAFYFYAKPDLIRRKKYGAKLSMGYNNHLRKPVGWL